jgi:hypothetical protein
MIAFRWGQVGAAMLSSNMQREPAAMPLAGDKDASSGGKCLGYPSALPTLLRPLLVTTVDTEESFDWAKPFTRDAYTLAAIGQQSQFIL